MIFNDKEIQKKKIKNKNSLKCNENQYITHIRVAGLLLDHLQHLPIVFAGCFGKFSRSLFHEQLSLSRLVILFAEDSCQFLVDFDFVSGDVGPYMFESVDWIRLKSRYDGFQR